MTRNKKTDAAKATSKWEKLERKECHKYTPEELDKLRRLGSPEEEAKYRQAARELYEGNDCDIEIDDDCQFSDSRQLGSDGVWVQAWVWVHREDVGDIACENCGGYGYGDHASTCPGGTQNEP